MITEAAIDSRQVIPGSLFVAIPGERVDGHDFLDEAFKRGASFALIQQDVDASFRTLDLRAGLKADSIPDLIYSSLPARGKHCHRPAADRPFLATQIGYPCDRHHRQRRKIHHQRNGRRCTQSALPHTAKVPAI